MARVSRVQMRYTWDDPCTVVAMPDPWKHTKAERVRGDLSFLFGAARDVPGCA